MVPRLWSLAYTGWVRKLLVLGLLMVVVVWYCDRRVRVVSGTYLFDTVEQLPDNLVGVVLGTSEKVRSGRPNLYFEHRMQAAAELYHAGKVKHLLLSGDNRTMQYNEPWAMRRALMAAGVDSAHITLDYAGFRTLDSMVRAREVFGQQRFTVISQRFHNERAVFIARRLGIDAIGYNARDVNVRAGFRTMVRERAARVKVFLDVLLGVGPKFLGDPVPIVNVEAPTSDLDPELHLEHQGPVVP
ncbi:MAG: YdcF family protein [Flavobacteriales bacterium]|nr:YdcF family protein [Flavobacteriales bacterium]